MIEAMDIGLRDALIGDADIAARLGQWNGEPSVHTRRPLPDSAKAKPLIAINPPVSIDDEDGLTSDRPVVVRDLVVYGDQPDDYREVVRIADLMRLKFHRQKFSVSVEGFSVIDVRARGPFPAPADDEASVGRLLSLTIRLRRL